MKKTICCFIFLFSCLTCCLAQNYHYRTTGNVRDTSHHPISGAVVREVGVWLNATITDINGNYSFNVSNEHCFLECSCIGYITKTILRDGQVNNFDLEEDGEQSESMNGNNSIHEGRPLICDQRKLLLVPDKAAPLPK